MRWVSNGGYGHAVIETTDDGYKAACGRTIALEAEGVETGNLQERPYGPDTCKGCHQTVKTYALGTAPVPEGLFAVPEPNSPKARMTAAEREASIRGETTPAPDNAGDAGTDAPEAAPVRRAPEPEPGSDEDLGFEPSGTTGSMATSGGAVVVVPDKEKGRRRRGTPARGIVKDSDDSSDIDSD
jgi:hypothetical protein